jgi:glycosyltransferase involved in cell wall biosynthesis
LRVAVYLEQAYRSDGDAVYSDRSFSVFLDRLAEEVDELVLLGRLDPKNGRGNYRLSDRIHFVALPYYPSAANAGPVARAAGQSLRRFWHTLDRVDVVWLLGPHGLCLPFAALAAARRKRVVLGVRQELRSYIRGRRPRGRFVQALASAMEGLFRLAARRRAVVAVGPALARAYGRTPALLEISVSLVREADIVDPSAALARSYDGELRILSVGRLDTEKNPLLLAEVLALLRAHDERWRLIVCGDGPLRGDLARRLGELDVDGASELRGHVPINAGLIDLYRRCHFLLHVSLTEGVPQVLVEAFASGTPVVATDVGGVRESVGDAAVLVRPSDAQGAAAALLRIAAEPGAREELVRAGHRRVRGRTIDAEARRVARFLSEALPH